MRKVKILQNAWSFKECSFTGNTAVLDRANLLIQIIRVATLCSNAKRSCPHDQLPAGVPLIVVPTSRKNEFTMLSLGTARNAGGECGAACIVEVDESSDIPGGFRNERNAEAG